nr:diaminopimelate epimerase [Frisingicoccus sp.]
MKFTKMHGCGNDYVYVNCFEETVKNPEEAAKIVSDRHYGVGSDGLILICPSDKADFRMAMYNLDGSEGKMCGNGVRCIAKYVYDHHLTDKTRISLETLGGIKYLDLNIKNGKVETVVVDMGEPVLTPEDIPVAVSGDQAVNVPLEVDGKVWYMTCISMGNPHAVVFVDNTKDLDLEKIGPKFEKHPIFPEQVNTEFVHVIDRHTVDMRVWERGSGETLACGTGACATAMACILNHMTDDEVLIHLLGGDLLIRYDRETNHIFMTGPAAEVFSGEIDL